jgi:hypothetical protein
MGSQISGFGDIHQGGDQGRARLTKRKFFSYLSVAYLEIVLASAATRLKDQAPGDA